jgi:hypothetical protein
MKFYQKGSGQKRPKQKGGLIMGGAKARVDRNVKKMLNWF